jgi:glycosyltransferase involved in cell wall biosynthesis
VTNVDEPTVAIVPWGDIFADWLDPLGVTPEQFRTEFIGSWMFSYIEALSRAGVRTILACFTSRVGRPTRWTHEPTGATMHFLPPARAFRAVRGLMLDARLGGRRDPATVGRAVVTHVAPYAATPVLRLARVLRRERCVGLLLQEYETPRFDVCVASTRILGTPIFATFQGGDYQMSRLERPLRPLTMRRAAGLIIPTHAESERVRARYRVPERRIRRIFNPIDTDRWRRGDRAEARTALGIAQEAIVVVWHGQLHRRKGLDVLFSAWKRLCEERPDLALELVVVGTGEALDEVRAAIKGLRRVRLDAEWVLDEGRLRTFLTAGDVYAFPSRHEGFPVAPIEAMACGLPLVATDAQGVRDIVEGEEHGGIVVARDDVEAFGRALLRLVDDAAARAELGRRARERVETAFSLEVVGAELRSLLVDRTDG